MKTKKKPVIQTETETFQQPLAWWGEVQQKSLTLAKWMSLFEAVNIIADNADDKKIPLDEVVFSPLDIMDYMSATEDIYLRKILEEDYKINICHNEDASEEIKNLFPEVVVDLN